MTHTAEWAVFDGIQPISLATDTDEHPRGPGAQGGAESGEHLAPVLAEKITQPGGSADQRWLTAALTLITVFMAGEVVIGIIAQSLALISDAAHMLTDAAAIVLALIAMRLAARPPKGGSTYGLKRAEILSAQANGLTLLLLGGWLAYEAVHQGRPPSGGSHFATMRSSRQDPLIRNSG